MKHYRLDPKNPRQLTPEQERRLAETPIDYSDIPPLMFGEGEPTALLLQMVLHHCDTGQRGELDSHGIAANDEAMRALHDSDYIEITAERDGRIFAKVLPDGWTLLDSLRAEQQRRP
jgi:hypothetical protein